MFTNFIFIIISLTASVSLTCVIFWIFLNKKIKLSEAAKVSCAATAINKLFLTGSGYAAMGYKLKRENLPFHKTFSSFVALELFLILPWLILGFCFGAKVAFRMPLFLAVFLGMFLVFVIFKKNKAVSFAKDACGHLKCAKQSIFAIIPLVLMNTALGISYYYFLFRAFGAVFPIADVIRISTVSVTIGYLSPSPAGLGFKESGLVLFLMQKNLSLKTSLSIAVADRVLVTSFYVILGLLSSSEMIFKELKAFFKQNKK